MSETKYYQYNDVNKFQHYKPELLQIFLEYLVNQCNSFFNQQRLLCL